VISLSVGPSPLSIVVGLSVLCEESLLYICGCVVNIAWYSVFTCYIGILIYFSIHGFIFKCPIAAID
jgi:hypothetical protein